MWHLAKKKKAIYTALYGQQSARKNTIDWWLEVIGLIPITSATIILSLVAMVSITSAFSFIATGGYWFLIFIFIGAIIGQGASAGNPFSQVLSAFITEGLFFHLKLHVLKRELQRNHKNKIEKLLKHHRENINALLERPKDNNLADEEVDKYLLKLEKESDEIILHRLLITYLNGKKDNRAFMTQELFDSQLEIAIDDILANKQIKNELLTKKILLIVFGLLVTFSAIGYSTITFTNMFGLISSISLFTVSSGLTTAIAAGAAGLVALVFGFGLYFQFHKATKQNIFKRLFSVLKDIFDPQEIKIKTDKWFKNLKHPSANKKRLLLLAAVGMYGAKITFLLALFGALLAITVLVSLFTAGASLNASVSTMNFILLSLHMVTPTTLTVAQWLATSNVGIILLTSTIFGYLATSEFIGNLLLLLAKTLKGELNIFERLRQRYEKYKVHPLSFFKDAGIALVLIFVFASYLVFDLIKMAIPLSASRNPTTDSIPSYMAFSTLFSAIVQTLNQIPSLLGVESVNGFVNASYHNLKNSFHDLLVNCKVQWEYWFGSQMTKHQSIHSSSYYLMYASSADSALSLPKSNDIVSPSYLMYGNPLYQPQKVKTNTAEIEEEKLSNHSHYAMT